MEVALEPDIVAFARNLYQASPAERVSLIRARVPASRIPELAAVMQVSRVSLPGMLNVFGASIRRKTRQGVMLSMEHSERVMGLLRLIGQVTVLVDDSGDSKEFNAAR